MLLSTIVIIFWVQLLKVIFKITKLPAELSRRNLIFRASILNFKMDLMDEPICNDDLRLEVARIIGDLVFQFLILISLSTSIFLFLGGNFG